AAGALVGSAVGATVVGAAVGGALVGSAVGGAVGGAWVVGGVLVPQALSSSANTNASADALRRINIIAPCTKNRPSMLKIGETFANEPTSKSQLGESIGSTFLLREGMVSVVEAGILAPSRHDFMLRLIPVA